MQLLRFNSWMKKSLKEQRKSQNIEYSTWLGPNQFDWGEDDEPVVTEKKRNPMREEIEEDVFGNQKKTKMKELEKLLKDFDWYFTYSDDRRSYKKGQEQQDQIRKLVDLIGKDGMTLYKSKGKIAGVFESVDKPRTLEQLVARRYGQSTVFPETRGVFSTGSLNELIPVGAKGTSYFSDAGNIYDNASQWTPPKEPKKSIDEKHLDRTSKFGKVYK